MWELNLRLNICWCFCFWPYEIQSNTTVCLVFCKSLKPSSQSLQVKTTGSVTTLLNWLWMLLRRNFTKRQKGRQACQPLVLNLGTTVIYHLLFEGCRRLSACVVELCVKRILELGVQRRAVRMTERRRWDGFQLAAFRLRQIAPQNQILKTGISSSTVFVTIFVVDVLFIYASFHAQNPLLAKTCCLILVLNVTRG